ncbi:hypothetical protein ASD64_13105 [Mesorhizobium sp. Root157]|nr:hypothetical protein ASD64_13105 [Mesorhizobium sp. Root157]
MAQPAAPRRARLALPSLRLSLAGAIGWGLAMGASALTDLLLAEWVTPAQIREISLMFVAGGALAFPAALYLARFVSIGRGREAAFAALFVCLLATTIAFTSGLHALLYWLLAERHTTVFSGFWFSEVFFTIAAALYQFAVLGIRLYLPIGFVALLLTSLWFAQVTR